MCVCSGEQATALSVMCPPVVGLFVVALSFFPLLVAQHTLPQTHKQALLLVWQCQAS